MKITVSKIPEGGMRLQFKKDQKWFQSFLPEEESCDFVLQTISVACTVRRMKETVFIEGIVESVAEAPCCRCLELCRLPVSSSFRYTFTPAPAHPQEDLELSAKDLEFEYYVEDAIDLDTLVFEQLLLQIPIKPLCAEACKGLCPHCGINLNVASCSCKTGFFDERLSVLKQFKSITREETREEEKR